MKKNIVWVVLGASLLTNALFVGGLLYARNGFHGRIEVRNEMRVADMNLAPEQVQALRSLSETVRSRAMEQREEMRHLLVAFREQLEAGADPVAVTSLLGEMVDKRHDQQRIIIDDLALFMDQLDEGQRLKFIRFARRTPIFRILGLGFRPSGPANRATNRSGFGPQR